MFSLIAFQCIVGTQIVFWTWTYPANSKQITGHLAQRLASASFSMGVFACNGRGPEFYGAHFDGPVPAGR